MARTSSYYLYEKFEKRGDQDWIPSYPNVYSKDGDGTMPLVVRIARDEACGWKCDPEYQWVDVPIEEGYVCDECDIDIDFRWVGTSAYTYIGDYRYEILQEQFRKDEGEWTDTQNTKLGNPVKVGKKIKITFANGDVFSQSCGSDDGVWHSYLSGGKYYSETAIQHESNKTDWGDDIRFIDFSESHCCDIQRIELGECVTELGRRYRHTWYKKPCTDPKCIDTGGGGGCGKSYFDNDVSTSGERMKDVSARGLGGFGAKEIILPEGLRWIGGGDLAGNKISAITLPSTVETIGYVRNWDTQNPRESCVDSSFSYAFADNYQLVNLSLNEGLKSIGSMDFYRCLSLERVEIPSTLEKLGVSAFTECINLKQIIFKGETPPEKMCCLDSQYYAWDRCTGSLDLAVNDDTYIYIPCGTSQAYSQLLSEVPSDRIVEYSGSCDSIPSIPSMYREFFTYKISGTTYTKYRGLRQYSGLTLTAGTKDFAMIDYADEITIPYNTLIPNVEYYDPVLPRCGKFTLCTNDMGWASGLYGFYVCCDEFVVNTSAKLRGVGTSAKKLVIKQPADIQRSLIGGEYLEEIYIEANAIISPPTDCTNLRDIYITYTGGVISVPSGGTVNVGTYPIVHVPCELYGRYKEHVFWRQFNIVKNDDSCVEPEIIFEITSNNGWNVTESTGQFGGNTYVNNAVVEFRYKNIAPHLEVRVCGAHGGGQYVTVYVDGEQVYERRCYNTSQGQIGWMETAYNRISDGNEHTLRIVSHVSDSTVGSGNSFILTAG